MGSLRLVDGGRIACDSELQAECAGWGISIDGRTRESALAYLDNEVRLMSSDGVDCDFKLYVSMIGQSPAGGCMCARLLMMLHDVREEDCTRAMFLRLQGLRSREVRGRE